MEIFVQQRCGDVRVGWIYHIEDKFYTKVEEVGLLRVAELVGESKVPENVKKAVQIMMEGE